MAESWSWGSPPECNCEVLRQQHPHAHFVDGHLASPLSSLTFSSRLKRLLPYSMDSQLHPYLHRYIHSAWPAVDRWLRPHNVFTVAPEDWHRFVQQEWSQHKAAVFTRLKSKDAVFIKNSLAGLFSYGRDHAITHGHAFWQRIVWQTYKSTFADTAVYQQLPMQPLQADEFLRSTASRLFLRRYKRAVNLRTFSLPIACLLLKQKKDVKGATPIISYIHFLYAKLQNCSELQPLCLTSFFVLPVLDLLYSRPYLVSFTGSQCFCSSSQTMLQLLCLLDSLPQSLSFAYGTQSDGQSTNIVCARTLTFKQLHSRLIFENRTQNYAFGEVVLGKQQKVLY